MPDLEDSQPGSQVTNSVGRADEQAPMADIEDDRPEGDGSDTIWASDCSSLNSARPRRRGADLATRALGAAGLPGEQATDGLKRLDMIANGFHHHEHRNRQNGAPCSPEPRPEQYAEENDYHVHPLGLTK
jgi:hypothetical protein